MSEIKVNKLTPRTNCGTTTLGDSGDTINIPAGVTISNNGTATGFGATGAVNWDVSSIKTVTFTATAGVGYFVDTATTGAVTVNLPAGTAGDVIGVADYAQNFASANCTIAPNGTEKIGGVVIDSTLSTNGIAVTLVYVDGTKGWIVTDSGNQSDAPGPEYVAATGGCITTCGNYKVHTFNSPATFTVSSLGNPSGSTTVEYLVVAGGGGGGTGVSSSYASGGGGAGGMRYSFPNPDTGGEPVSIQGYPIVVGGGGGQGPTCNAVGNDGTDSSALGVTSTGGGGGATGPGNVSGRPGGSGGGAGYNGQSFGTGNTPPVSPSQGNDGGIAPASPGPNTPGQNSGAGGGGHGGAGEPNAAYPSADGSSGGAGTPLTIAASPSLPGGRAYAGGGAGSQAPVCRNTGVPGGGAAGLPNTSSAKCGVANTGGGGSGGWPISYGAGGSGVVIIRYRYQ